MGNVETLVGAAERQFVLATGMNQWAGRETDPGFLNLGGMMESVRNTLGDDYLGVLEINCHSDPSGWDLGPDAPPGWIEKPEHGHTTDQINVLYSTNVQYIWDQLKTLKWRTGPSGQRQGIILLTGCNSGLRSPSDPKSYAQGAGQRVGPHGDCPRGVRLWNVLRRRCGRFDETRRHRVCCAERRTKYAARYGQPDVDLHPRRPVSDDRGFGVGSRNGGA